MITSDDDAPTLVYDPERGSLEDLPTALPPPAYPARYLASPPLRVAKARVAPPVAAPRSKAAPPPFLPSKPAPHSKAIAAIPVAPAPVVPTPVAPSPVATKQSSSSRLFAWLWPLLLVGTLAGACGAILGALLVEARQSTENARPGSGRTERGRTGNVAAEGHEPASRAEAGKRGKRRETRQRRVRGD